MRTTTSKDGTAIAWFTSGSGPPLVLVHGTAADHQRWNSVLPALEERFTVHAVDRRGRGASGDSATYAIEREFEDVAAVVDAIGEPVFLLGHSYGGVCALEAALRTSNVKKLVLYEPPIPTGETPALSAVISTLEALLAEGKREDVVVTFLRDVPRLPPGEIEMQRKLPTWSGRVAAAHTIPRELRIDLYSFHAEQFAAVRTPTLLLLGGASPPMFKAAIDRVQGALPESRVQVLPGQQHTAMNTAPDLFVAEVVRFLLEQ